MLPHHLAATLHGMVGGEETELQMSPENMSTEQGRVGVRERLHDDPLHQVHYVGDLSRAGGNGVYLVAITPAGKS